MGQNISIYWLAGCFAFCFRHVVFWTTSQHRLLVSIPSILTPFQQPQVDRKARNLQKSYVGHVWTRRLQHPGKFLEVFDFFGDGYTTRNTNNQKNITKKQSVYTNNCGCWCWYPRILISKKNVLGLIWHQQPAEGAGPDTNPMDCHGLRAPVGPVAWARFAVRVWAPLNVSEIFGWKLETHIYIYTVTRPRGPGGSMKYQFVYLNVVTVCLNELDSVCLNGPAGQGKLPRR